MSSLVADIWPRRLLRSSGLWWGVVGGKLLMKFVMRWTGAEPK